MGGEKRLGAAQNEEESERGGALRWNSNGEKGSRLIGCRLCVVKVWVWGRVRFAEGILSPSVPFTSMDFDVGSEVFNNGGNLGKLLGSFHISYASTI